MFNVCVDRNTLLKDKAKLFYYPSLDLKGKMNSSVDRFDYFLNV